MAIKRFIYILVFAYLLLLCAVWILPVGFTACSIDSWWCRIAYLLTESAGKIGTVAIVAGAALFFTFRAESIKEKVIIFCKTVLSIGFLLGILAFFNENVIKERLKIARPSHTFIMKQSEITAGLDSLYILNDDGRKEYLQHTINSHKNNFENIDTTVLSHWIAESGYSFPSGHSCNAFLLAYILAFSMYHSRNKVARLFYFVPFLWAVLVAVSRVAIGAHSALDVSIGAALGLLVAILFFYFDWTRQLIHPEKSNI